MNESHVVGTAGHVTGSITISAVQEIEKLKKLFLKGCPVNRRTPTRMTLKSFRKNCMTFQRRAGVFKEATMIGSSSTPAGWRTNNVSLCTSCGIGEVVRNGGEHEAPLNLTFVTIKELRNGDSATKSMG